MFSDEVGRDGFAFLGKGDTFVFFVKDKVFFGEPFDHVCHGGSTRLQLFGQGVGACCFGCLFAGLEDGF